MFFQCISTPGIALNTYLVGCTETKNCVLIDVPRQITACMVAVENANLKLTHILETHVHADFISGSLELKNAWEGKPIICCSEMGGKEWTPSYVDHYIKDQDCIQIGSIRLTAIHTPGHSPEHLMWVCYDEKRNKDFPCLAFTGDFLLVDGVGRPDLLGKENEKLLFTQLLHSLTEKLKDYPDFMEIYPCHSGGSICGPSSTGKTYSTLGYEKLTNPYLKNCSQQDQLEALNKNLKPYAPHLNKIKEMNVSGPALLENLTTLTLEGSIDEMGIDKLFILDIRTPQKFADFHLHNSLNIPLSETFTQWCTWFLPKDFPLGIVTDDHLRDTQITSQLRLMGFDQPLLFLSLTSRVKNHVSKENLTLLKPQEVKLDKNYTLIDVRTLSEWQEGHIENAQHSELTTFEKFITGFQKDLPITVVCRSGLRASIAASILQKNGFQDVSSIQGGMQAWIAANLPLIKN